MHTIICSNENLTATLEYKSLEKKLAAVIKSNFNVTAQQIGIYCTKLPTVASTQ